MWRRLGLEPPEERIVLLGGAVLFLLGAAGVSVKNASEVFFVKRVGVELLPLAFLASSLVLVATSTGVARLAARRDRLRLLPAILLALGALLPPLWLLLRAHAPTGSGLLLVAAKQVQSIGLLVFLLAFGDLVHSRQAKRLLAPLLAALTLGTILGSFASEPIGRRFGIDALLPLAAGLLLLAALAALRLRRRGRTRLERRRARAARADVSSEVVPAARLWRESRLFRLLAATTLLNALLDPMLYFQFQYAANLATTGDNAEVRLLSIYGQLRGWIYVGILVAQLGFASRLFRRIGLPLAASISPFVYLGGFLGLSLRLSLPVSVAAQAGTKLADGIAFDPALRVLYNLFREGVRSRAGALLEGPIKRGGGALGNALTQLALWTGSPAVVGVAALPLAAAWCVAALVLWRRYPSLLVQAATARGRLATEALPLDELLDPNTERFLARQLEGSDPASCRIAIDLLGEASRERALPVLARAARNAPDATRPLLLASLDRLLESSVAAPLWSRRALDDLHALLEASARLSDAERADVVQACGRLAAADPREEDRAVLLRAAEEEPPAVRLAALAALARIGEAVPDLDARLAAAATGDDPAARRTAREELRALLLEGDPGSHAWRSRLEVLAGLLDVPEARADAAEALADISLRHGAHASAAGPALDDGLSDSDPRVRAAALRFAGHTGQGSAARRIAAEVGAEDEGVAAAAREALRALGAPAAQALLVELAYGRRSRSEAILRLLAEIEVDPLALRGLYARELEAIRNTLICRAGLEGGAISPLVLARLDERMEEGLHTALLLLAALHDRDEIAEVARHLRRTSDPRRRAILLEALEALLEPEERKELVPLLEDRPLAFRAQTLARATGVPIPPLDLALESLRADADDLVRQLASRVAPGSGLREAPDVLSPVEIAVYLRKTPLFERLGTRPLLELASAVREERHPADAVLVREGEYGTSLYLIVEGSVRITRAGQEVAQLGPEDFFGEMGLLEGAERSATATTVGSARLLRLERDDLLSLMDEIPAIAIGVAQELSRRLREALQKFVY